MFSVVCVLLVEILCFGCTFSDPNVVSKDARIVEGTDRVSGSGIDHTLTYVTPSGFYGPEALYLLHGLCFTDTVDRCVCCAPYELHDCNA